MILPALSLSQPWCELVLDHGKDIENRVWNCHKRGVFLIHAAKGMTSRGYDEALRFAGEAVGVGIALPAKLDRGGIIGAAEILDVIPRDEPERSRHPCSGNRWLMDGCYGFVLGRRVRLPFRPYAGRQRWFPVELTDAETNALAAAGLIDRTRIRMQSLEVEFEGSAEGAKRLMGEVGRLLRGTDG